MTLSVPPTERLYWSRPQDRDFESTVLAVTPAAVTPDVGGPLVALEGTLFYPQGGGQEADAGLLRWAGGEARVTDVQKDDGTGIIWHRLDSAAPPVGTAVRGELDWTRRFRHTQRHSAEHLLAQAFLRVNPAFGVRAVSMRGPECTLDLAGEPTERDARAAEALLMARLRDDLTLETAQVSAADLARYPLRRPPQVGGTVRVVLFREPGGAGDIWEASACGGTHLPRASQAAPVVVTGLERVKGGLTRVTFMAGEEATEALSHVYREAQALARGFSAGLPQLPERVHTQGEALLAAEHTVASLRTALARERARHADWQPLAPEGRFVLLRLDDSADLPAVLDVPLQPGDVLAALCDDGRCGVASTHPEHPAQVLLRLWLSASGGRGGGKPGAAQGRTDDPEPFRAAAQNWYIARHEIQTPEAQ